MLLLIIAGLVGCGPRNDAPPIIASPSEFSDTLDRVTKLSEGPLLKSDAGEELTEKEKADLAEAARLSEGMADYKPYNFATHMLAGKCYLALGQPQKAELKLREALATIPADSSVPMLVSSRAELQRLHSLAFERNGAYEEAERAAQEAVDAFPDNPDYLAQLASAKIQIASRESLKGAEDAIAHALEIDPENKRAKQLKTLLDLAVANEGSTENATK